VRLVHARSFGKEPAAQIGDCPIAPATRKAYAYMVVNSSCTATTSDEIACAAEFVAIASSMRTMPATNEHSPCRRRWTKAGAGMG